MEPKLLFIGLILSIILISDVHAENQIPQILLDQKVVEWDSYQPQNDTRIMIDSTNEHIRCPPATTRLVDWRLSSEEEAELIAESFIKNSEDILGVSFDDLKIQRIIFSADQNDNPSASIWYEHYFDGKPVFESRLLVSINTYGTIWSVKDQLNAGTTAPTTPIITSDEAIRIAKERYNQAGFESEKDPGLIIYENRLVWRLNILAPIFKEVMIDSQNGEIVLERKNVMDEGNDAVPVPKPANVYYYIIPIILVLAILAYLILRKKR